MEVVAWGLEAGTAVEVLVVVEGGGGSGGGDGGGGRSLREKPVCGTDLIKEECEQI